MARLAVLAIQGGMPGTEVVMDRTSIGTVQADGSFAIPPSPLETTPSNCARTITRPARFRSFCIRFAGLPGPHGGYSGSDARRVARNVFSPEADVTLNGNGQPITRIKNGSTLKPAFRFLRIDGTHL